MTNNFYKKDALTDAVKSVMEVNQFHREAEALVNEKFGVVSRKALPHEQQAAWDAEFDSIISEGAMKRMSMGDDGGMETYRKKPANLSPKQMKIAKMAGDPEKIDAEDLAALRAGKKTEQIDEISRDLATRASFASSDATSDTKKPLSRRKKHAEMSRLAVAKVTGYHYKDKDGKWRFPKVRAVPRPVKMPGEAEQMDEMDLSGIAPSKNVEDKRTKGSRLDRPVSNQVTKSNQMKTPAMSKSDRLDEKKLTDAEMAKREEIVKSMKKKMGDFEKRYPGRGKEVMYATATKQAKELAEEKSIESIHEEIAMNLYAELNYVMENFGEEAGDEWIANLSEEQLEIMEEMSLQDFMNRPASKAYMAKDPERSNRAIRGTAAINRNAQAQRGMAQARAGSTDAARQRREADMAQSAREQGANKIRQTGPGFDQQRRNQPQDNTRTAPLAKTPRGYEGGAPAQKVDAKTMKATASSPVQQAARQALNNKPASQKKAAPVQKAKPAAPKPTFKANFKGGFGQKATSGLAGKPERRGSDR